MTHPLALLAGPAGFAAGGALALYAPGLLRRRAFTERRLLALASGALAAFAPGDPTGLTAVDVVYKVLLGALVVHLGARANRRLLLFASLLATVAALGSDVVAVAFAGTGLLAGVMLTARRSPLPNAVVAATVVQAVLRLDLDPHGLSALAAAVCTLPLLVSGTRRSRQSERRALKRMALGAVVAGVLAGLAGLAAAGLAARPVDDGINAAARGLDKARDADATASRTSFQRAAHKFSDASSTLSAWWAAPARLVPVLAQHLSFAREVSHAGRTLAASGVTATAAADVERLQVVNGALDLGAVRALGPPLRQAAATADTALHGLEEADSPWLLHPLQTRLNRETRRVERAEGDARRAADIVDRLPSLLGGEQPRRYFLLVEQPAESRALGGFIGNYGEITAVNGKVELAKFGRTRELQTGGTPQQRRLVAPDDYVRRYSRFDPAVTWQNVTMSPDGPTVAQVVAGLYPQSGGSPIDGVIAVDPAGLAALLRLTGPVRVAPWPEPLTAENAERILLLDQYVSLPDPAREDFLGDVADAVTRRLTSRTLPRPKALIDALAPAVASGHLAVMSSVEADAKLLADLHLDLAVPPVADDFVALVTQNASASKIDTFLHRSYDYTVDLDGDGRVSATLAVTLRNDAPSSGLPDVVIGNGLTPPLPKGTSRLYLSVYSPWGLESAELDGQPSPMEAEEELGRRVYSRYVDIGPGEQKTLTIRYAGVLQPGSPARTSAGYAIAMRHQPGTDDDVRTTVNGREVARTRLTTDRRVVATGAR